MNINLKSEEFKNNLYSLIENSELPISNIYFIFKTVSKELEETYNQVIKELKEQESQQKQIKENNIEETIEEENNK